MGHPELFAEGGLCYTAHTFARIGRMATGKGDRPMNAELRRRSDEVLGRITQLRDSL
jgi:hypothetical protein